MSDPLYKREILRLAADAHGAGRLTSPTATGMVFNPICGDRVSVDLMLVNGRVEAVAHETKACVLAQASASILGTALAGSTRSDVELLRRTIEVMLVEGQSVAGSPFERYDAFEGAVSHVARHKCVLLPIDAVLNAFDNSERTEPGGERAEQ